MVAVAAAVAHHGSHKQPMQGAGEGGCLHQALPGRPPRAATPLPQVFIKGEFVGGSDILHEMHQKGELINALKGVKMAE